MTTLRIGWSKLSARMYSSKGAIIRAIVCRRRRWSKSWAVAWKFCRWSASVRQPASSAGFERSMARQRAGQFDAAVIFTVYSQNPLPAALFCHLADIPRRLAHARENPYQLLTDWIAEPEPQRFVRHEVQRQLDLVGAIGARIDDPR